MLSSTEASKFNTSDLQIDPSSEDTISINEEASSQLFVWSGSKQNTISILDLKSNAMYATFDRAQHFDMEHIYSWAHVKEIPNTKLLVSLQFTHCKSASMKIFDISHQSRIKNIGSFVIHGAPGEGDVSYNKRRNFLGTFSLQGKFAYHLFNIEYGNSQNNHRIKLLREAKCQSQKNKKDNWIASLDFHPNGELIATADRLGMWSLSNIDTNLCNFHIELHLGSGTARCRWSSNCEEPLLYVKHSDCLFNILDVEKKVLTLKSPIILEENEPDFLQSDTNSIDVCPINGTLVAADGWDQNIKIYDRRSAGISKKFNPVHKLKIACVRWDASGNMLGSSDIHDTAIVTDFKTGKMIFTGKTPNGEGSYGTCFV